MIVRGCVAFLLFEGCRSSPAGSLQRLFMALAQMSFFERICTGRPRIFQYKDPRNFGYDLQSRGAAMSPNKG